MNAEKHITAAPEDTEVYKISSTALKMEAAGFTEM
jgi:hypothetical protein